MPRTYQHAESSHYPWYKGGEHVIWVKARFQIVSNAVFWFCVAIGLGLSMQLGFLFIEHQGNPMCQIRLGRLQAEMVGTSRCNLDEEDGFDGQFFYLMGADPLLRGDTIWRTLGGSPHLRARRIGLAWIGVALGLGPDGREIGLLLAQSLSLLALLVTLQCISFRVGMPPWVYVAVPLLLPVLTPLEFVTAELLAGALVVGALAAAASRRYGLVVVCAGFACLCKEICVLVVVALVIEAAFEKHWWRCAYFALSVIPLLAWVLYLQTVMPSAPNPGTSFQNIDWPFVGAWSASMADFAALMNGEHILRAGGNLMARFWYLVLVVMAVPMTLRGRHSASRVLLAFSALLALVLSSGGQAFAYDSIFNFARQLFLLPLAAVAILALEWTSLSRGEKNGLQVWLWVGAAIGLAWAGQQIFF